MFKSVNIPKQKTSNVACWVIQMMMKDVLRLHGQILYIWHKAIWEDKFFLT